MLQLFTNHTSTYSLLILALSSCFRICHSTLEEEEKILATEHIARPEVRIPDGLVQGINMITHHGRKILGFKGIPFAQPPVGNLRFSGPIPAEPWNGTLDASRDSRPCLQAKGEIVTGDEDCLYLNVYTPQLPASENHTLLPVMVYIYGGGFRKGSATSMQFGPYFLLDKDLVLVVANYRLGVLGWLSTGDEVSPGNYGLKDMVRALEWNRDNIQFFGGNPSQVTLAGGSSGAMSVELLTLSNLTNGLFHRYITQSGSALSPGAQRPRKAFANRSVQLGNYFHCGTNMSTDLIKCLRDIDAVQLLKTDSVFFLWQSEPSNIWGPTLELDIKGALLTDTPTNFFAAGKGRDLPWLSSHTQTEGVFYRAMVYNDVDVFQDLFAKIDFILPSLLMYDNLIDNVTAYTVALKSYYLNDLTADRDLLLDNFTQLAGDILFNYPTYVRLQQQFVHAKSPYYFCFFEYQGTFSHSYGLTNGDTVKWGAVHGDEILYLFQSPSGFYGPSDQVMNEVDWKMVDIMVQLWTSFVINGTPTTSDSYCNVILEPYSLNKNYLQIGSKSNVSCEVKYNFFDDHFQFWEELTSSTSRK